MQNAVLNNKKEKFRIRLFSVHNAWCTLFFLWFYLLSGLASPWVVASPGLLQCLRLKKMKEEKDIKLLKAEEEIKQLQTKVQQICTNSFVQEQEIRKKLGYIAKDEILFDFRKN